MPITYKEAKDKVSEFAGRGGKCASAPEVDSFLREVLTYMLNSGQYGNQRTFTFTAVKGVITVPFELETPLKVKINNEVGMAWDRWYDFMPFTDLNGCLPDNALVEESNYSPLVFDVPPGGAQIGALPMCDESADAYIIVKGQDCTGRQIITTHNGESVVGEYLSLVKGQIRYTQTTFGKITEVVKTKTNGYTQLLWVNPSTQERGFLADYSPFEEHPQYRRYRLNTRCSPFAKVTVLGRIRLKPYYADNDLIPFDNLFALSLAAQTINRAYNKDYQNAAASDNLMMTQINREQDMKKVNSGRAIEVGMITSGGSIKNIVF